MKVVVAYSGDEKTVSGGGRQLYRLADVLSGLGMDACVAHTARGARCLWFRSETKVVCASDVEVGAEDFVVMPETLRADPPIRGMDRCRRAMYVQNPQNIFMGTAGNMSEIARTYSSAAGVLCQSKWTEDVVGHFFPRAKVLPVRYSFDRPPFSYCGDKGKVLAYMPRKCAVLAEAAFWLMSRDPALMEGWKVVPVDGKTEEEVAAVLRGAAVFMALGWMEGFGMPAAEAMACGCAVVGFPGFAGEEFMLPELCWPVREQDPLSLSMAVEKALSTGMDELVAKGRMASEYVRRTYSTEKEVAGIEAAWKAMAGRPAEVSTGKEKAMEKLEARKFGKRVKVVVMSHDQPENVDRLFKALYQVFDDVEVFDSGSAPDKVPKSVTRSFPNIYWTGLWDEVRRTCQGYDAVWVLGGDVELRSKPEEYRKAIEDSLPFGCWSPSVTGRAKPSMQSAAYGGKPRSVWNIEGIAMAASGEMLRGMGEFPKGNDTGMGQDLWMCWRARQMGMRNVVDGRTGLFHPEGTGYDMADAERKMEETYARMFGRDWRRDAFHYSDYFEENVVDWPAVRTDKDFVVATVDNGWGLEDFRRIVGAMPGAKGLVVAKGLLVLPEEGGMRSVPYSGLEEAMSSADAFLFAKVGDANEEDYEKVLRAGVPVVVHKAYDKGLVNHQKDGFLYIDDGWALRWLALLRDKPSARKEIEEEWRARMAAEGLGRVVEPELVEVCSSGEPKVTVITPTYRRDLKVLFRCLSCMKLQTETSWEQVVCSDGGEEPETRRVVESFGDPRARYAFTEEKKAGDFGNTVRREMLKEAKGKYVLFFDDDNIILPHYLERMVRALEENPEVGFAACRVMHFGPLNEVVAGKPPKVLEGDLVALYHVDPLQVLVRREAMLKVGWDTEVGYLSDGVTLERLGKEFKHVRVDEVLGVHV
jgi:glycosyltransferase involved in cell wall biosynthesis